MFNNEVDIYANLRDADFDHIVRYYGSFSQLGKFTIILEYANQGNLLDYFERTAHPPTPSDRVVFWQAFFDLLLALERIHELSRSKGLVLRG